ncbi:MAG TPA: glycosyltransferase, partial [Gemmataceae bacterium]|nr:glycosyltransferase [Gemmataceae bacterium]
IMLVQALCVVLLAPAVACCAYYLLLAAVQILAGERRSPAGTGAAHTFAILIPAHDEEATLPAALAACAALDYPADRVTVYVVADNCTDRTAQVGAAAGAVVLERHDTGRRGKGPALAWALERVLPALPDAVVILDADCRLDPHALRDFDERLSAGDAVLQASYVAANPEESGISYAVAVGNVLENDLFYAPKSRIGLAVLLRGTGMVFRRDVLEAHPWRADSVTEDTEHTLDLLRAGVRVRFLPHTRVVSDFPAHAGQLGVQRRRWAAGNLRFGRAQAPRLMAEGFAKRSVALFDLGWTLLVVSRPLVLAEALAALGAGIVCAALVPGPLSAGLLTTGLAVVLLQALYVGLGVVRLGVSPRRLVLLAGSVAAFVRLLGITLRGLFGGDKLAWVRTPRE